MGVVLGEPPEPAGPNPVAAPPIAAPPVAAPPAASSTIARPPHATNTMNDSQRVGFELALRISKNNTSAELVASSIEKGRASPALRSVD